jgi:trimeric autotransporter adhesin
MIMGLGFVSSSTVQWNGAPVVTTFGSSTTLNAVLPAASLSNGTVAKLTVVNPSPGGGTSPGVDFFVNNPTPMISKINPTSIFAGSGDTVLDISGSGFDPSSVITWNGTTLATTFVSGSEVKVTLPAADLTGSSASLIVVQNPAPGGGPSAAATFDVADYR